MTTNKTPLQWCLLLSVFVGLCMIASGVKRLIVQQIATAETAVEKTTNTCWFLTSKVERVLSSDLAMWTHHLDHNPNARMSEWFDLRLAEVVKLYSSKGVTEVEVTACLDSLAMILAEEQ